MESIHEKFIKHDVPIKAVSTSTQTTSLAKSLGIEILDFNAVKDLAVVIDGADEVDPNKNLIKGGGGALLMEKLVANFSKDLIIIVDQTKLVNSLGNFPLPIEIVKFGSEKTKGHIYSLLNDLDYINFEIFFRKDQGNNYLTDESNFILDLHLNQIKDPYTLNQQLLMVPGVIEVGLFLNMASKVIVGQNDNSVKIF